MRRVAEMLIVWLLIIAVIVLLLRSDEMPKKTQQRIALALAFVVPILASLRDLGLDLPNYQQMYSISLYPFFSTAYESFASLFSHAYEPLNYILGGILGADGFRAYLFIATFPAFFVAYGLAKERASPLKYYCIFILLNLFFIDQTRQFFAESFILASLSIQSYLVAVFVSMCAGLAHFGTLPAAAMAIFRDARYSQVSSLAVLVFLAIVVGLGMEFLGAGAFASESAYLSSRLNSYSVGVFFSATNAIRFANVFFPAISTIVFFLFSPKILDINASDRAMFSARNNAISAFMLFISILLITRNDVFSTRLFSALSVGNFMLVGHYLETAGKGRELKVVLWLLSLNIVWSAYYVYLYVA